MVLLPPTQVTSACYQLLQREERVIRKGAAPFAGAAIIFTASDAAPVG